MILELFEFEMADLFDVVCCWTCSCLFDVLMVFVLGGFLSLLDLGVDV